MATLLLGAAGGALGGALFGPVGALVGRAAGALGGAVVDAALFSGKTRTTGPRLSDLPAMTSTEGAGMARLYGRARLSGQVIWAQDVEEVVSTATSSSGGKGGSLFGSSTTTTYSYFCSFAVGLCEGPITRIGRIWVDGEELDQQGLVIRAHLGGEAQEPDALIAAVEGAGSAPAYRGLAYLLFERLPLADYGNRLPQVSVEVERAIGDLEPRIRAVTLIPGASEFAYDTREVVRAVGSGSYEAENRHVTTADTDIEASLDQLLACCPNLERVALIVSWFGTDLRAGHCEIRPGVDRRSKATRSGNAVTLWSAAGQTRASAHLVSQYDGYAAYGGTPSDISVLNAIAALKARGLKVTLYPFVMMDIAAGNGLPDPYGGAGQAAYPWRGRITCHPAPDVAGTVDGTAEAATQVASLFGTAAPGDFAARLGTVVYSGPDEWGLRRMVLHYARLARLAGGVEAFVIGSEMVGLTRVRSASGVYPAVAQFANLAADVKAVLGAGTLVTYAADWTEYGAHVREGGAELRFPLDPLWACPAIDAVGIDWYAPIADWRDGSAHLDATLARSVYERGYLASNVRGGEGFDWYYPDDAGRTAQNRLPITDGAYGEPWVFRVKDLAGWWGNAHHERIGGVRQASPTGWVPGSKPIRLTEIGCGAIDKGANRPSTFPDPKSVENGLPPFSNGARDDLMQRRHLEASFDAFATDAVNPPAPGLPGGRMIDPATLFCWTWDVRPWPVFPLASDVWADGANWQKGHWLTGRLGAAPIAELARTLAADAGVTLAVGNLEGVVDGYALDGPMSVRAALEPLGRAFAFDLAERSGALTLVPRGGSTVASLTDEDLVAVEGSASLSLTRGSESELPLSVTLGFLDALADYRQGAAASRRLAGAARAQEGEDLAVMSYGGLMESRAEMWLQDLWARRETASFALPPSRLALEAGDIVRLDRDGRSRLLEITGIEDGAARAVSARSVDPDVFRVAARDAAAGTVRLPAASGPPAAWLVNLPALDDGEPATLAHVAAFSSPWPGALALWRALDGASFTRIGTLPAPSVMGETLTDLPAGPLWRWQRGAVLDVELYGGLLAAASEDAVLGGANAAALVAASGAVEIIQFAGADLIGTRHWRLAGLLRGQLGTEPMAGTAWPAGTRFLRLDAQLLNAAAGTDLIGRALTLRVGRADRDQGDPAVTALEGMASVRALLPYAPVHPRARRTAEGIALSWIRRSRIGGDGWDAAEIPLGEASEAYRVEILDGVAVRRSLTVSTPDVVYPAADELADFGAPLAALTVRIAQVSSLAGVGTPLTATLAL
ncbi:glycoside hydrolase/phage tail family protein [Ancylobacter sp. 6x-1]|uniref:Glycoside hydrolase/phage tail family protein n=1 Tax=Ancylobacter crimeensis TaxID=2579147 RepID=A0ABT0D8S4_9HYPH|nr:glycoside hydrolase/phage tail family protein [Ancylobacter crimeensis]MCK0196340.1 glycoside hydrolase/phage tail family protein [Ancylobacter crimeensis]